MTDNSGGYAFPQSETLGSVSHSTGGLTLRDYFAGQALSGLLANPNYEGQAFSYRAGSIEADSYYIADAMLKAREKC